MPLITYKDTVVTIDAPETVLEGLEKAGFKLPFSCRSGLCHSCMMQSDSRPPVTAQQGLSENQKLQNYFLACSCIPNTDATVNLVGDSEKIQGRVVEKTSLNETVLGLFIEVDCRWFPGQYLTLWKDDIEGRPYSIASRCQNEKIIELHIKRHDQGVVSRWLHDELAAGDTLSLSKPMGNCFYTDSHQDKSILMVSTGTGLAPLYGILQEALASGHQDPIHLYAAAGDSGGLYYVDELKALMSRYPNLHYQPVVRRKQQSDDSLLLESDLVPLIQQQYNDLNNWKVFLCGSPDMITQVQRHCFFQGAGVNDILVDAFVIGKPN